MTGSCAGERRRAGVTTSGSSLSTGTSVPGGTVARPGIHASFSYTIAPGSTRETVRSSCAGNDAVERRIAATARARVGRGPAEVRDVAHAGGRDEVAEPHGPLAVHECDRVGEHRVGVLLRRVPRASGRRPGLRA